MSVIEGSRSLLVHDNKLATKRWKEDIEAHDDKQRARIYAPAFLVTVTLIVSTIFILWLQWHSAFEGQGLNPPEPSGPSIVPGSERDLKLLLHPEAHVSRDPGIRRFSWSIKKAKKIAPDGVQKDVFLINGTSNFYLTHS
jgi:hypothetical protein